MVIFLINSISTYRYRRLFLLFFVLFNLNQSAASELVSVSEFDIKQYHGRVVYLDFWASWCGPCRASFPFLNSMHEKYQGQGLAVVGVSVDASLDDAQGFLREIPASFILFHDPEGGLAGAYQIQGMPSSLLFDKNGNLVLQHKGFKKADARYLEKQMIELLN